ncbi:hypothetical protein ACF0H5_021495 [Mactra antiquata]
METENSSEVDDTDKGSGVISKEMLCDKDVKLKVCFGDIDQSEDYVSDLNAEVDLDENLEVLVADNNEKADKVEVSPIVLKDLCSDKSVVNDEDGNDDDKMIMEANCEINDTATESENNGNRNEIELESGTSENDENKKISETKSGTKESSENNTDTSQESGNCKDVEKSEDGVNVLDMENGCDADSSESTDLNNKTDEKLVNSNDSSHDSLNDKKLCQATKESQNNECQNVEESNCDENNQRETVESVTTEYESNTSENNQSSENTETDDEKPNMSESSPKDENGIKDPEEVSSGDITEQSDGKIDQSTNTQSGNIENIDADKLESDYVEVETNTKESECSDIVKTVENDADGLNEDDSSSIKEKHAKIEGNDTSIESEHIEKSCTKDINNVLVSNTEEETDVSSVERGNISEEINDKNCDQNDIIADTNESDEKDSFEVNNKTKEPDVDTMSIKSDNNLQVEENTDKHMKESINENIEDKDNIDQKDDSNSSGYNEINIDGAISDVDNCNDNDISCDFIASIESLTDSDSVHIEEDDQSQLDKEGIQQFLKAVIDDLQGIVIETEECDNVIQEISSKDEERDDELPLPCVEICLESLNLGENIELNNDSLSTSCGENMEENVDSVADIIVQSNDNNESFEPNDDNVSESIERNVGSVNESIVHDEDKVIRSEKEEEKLDRLELIIDHTDSDDADIVNDVKDCELLIEERTDETIQCVNSSDNENTAVNVLDATNEADRCNIELTKQNSDVLSNKIEDTRLVSDNVLDETGVKILIFDTDVPIESSDKDVNSESIDKIGYSEDINKDIKEDNSLVPDSTDNVKLDERRIGNRDPIKVESKKPSNRMVTKETELTEVRSSLKVSQQLLLDERSKHNREVMSLKLQLCRSQMQLKCQKARSEKQMTDIMAQLVVLESRLLQEQKNLRKELRTKNQTIVSQRQEIIKLKDQNEQLLNAIKEICANGGMNGYMRRKNGSNIDVDYGGKSGKDKKGHNSGKLGTVKDKFLSKNRSSLELNSFNMEKYLLKDDRLCSSQEDLRKISENRRQSIPNGDTSLNGGEGFDVGAKDRPHSDSSEYKNRKSGRNSQNFFSEAGSPQYGINKSVSESSHLSETSNSSSGVYSLSDHDLSGMQDISITNGNHVNLHNDDEDDDHIFSFSSTHINTVIDEEAVMGPISHSGPMMSMGSMPMLANLSDEQCLRTGKHRPHSLSSVDLASIQLQAENLSSPGVKLARSPLASEMETPPGSPSNLQNKNEMTPFQTFKTMFRRKGSNKSKGHKKRSVSLSQTTNKEYSEALKKHFQKYDMS